MELRLNKKLMSDQNLNLTTFSNNKNWTSEYEAFLLKQKSYSPKTISILINHATSFLIHATENIEVHSFKLDDLHFISFHHLKTFENYLLKRKEKNEIRPCTAKTYIYKVKQFIDFLFRNKIISFQYNVPEQLKTSNSFNKRELNFLEDFEQYLLVRNYANTTVKNHIKKVTMICNDLANSSNVEINTLKDCHSINKEITGQYEQLLVQRIMTEEIKRTTAYSYIKSFRLFLLFLYHYKIIDFKYQIPNSFVVQPTLANTYVNEDCILRLAENIMQNPSNIKYRNLALLLLIVDTGCRPIEASNVRLSDVSFSRKTIVLHCIKSGPRTMKLNNIVIQTLKEYLVFRNSLNPQNDYLFLKTNGLPASNTCLSSIINRESKKIFKNKTSIVLARSLRHTYATKAVENKNDINDIARAMGHKYVQSTYGYVHRSKERLLKNTLSYNPCNQIFNEGMMNSGDQNTEQL
ncbi:MAG: tyrosine-type recombinase/integrase [Bacillaceae bacterium]